MIDFVKDFWSEGWIGRTVLIGIVLIIVALPFGIYAMAKAHHEWVLNCENMGGHVVDHTTHSTGLSADGKSTTTTSDTTYYCLNDEGGILDIE